MSHASLSRAADVLAVRADSASAAGVARADRRGALPAAGADDRRAGFAPARRPPERGRDEVDLAAIVREAGWPCPEEARAPFQVELETPQFATARVEKREPEGSVAVSVDLEIDEGTTAACARAVEVLLRRIAGAVRLVRPVPGDRASGRGTKLEAVLAQPSAEQMNEALAALSVAWRGAAREARFLHRDDAAARLYLALSGPDPRPSEPNAGRHVRPAGEVPAAVKQEEGDRR